VPRHFSLGEDRVLVEYDLIRSSIQDGVQLRKTLRIEQTALPAGLCWIGPQRAGGEPCVAASNELYKLRIVSVDSMATVQTVLGPTYGGALTKMAMLPGGEGGKYMAYSTAEKVVGLLKLPLDGNPNKAMGLIAHPAELSGLAVSWDGKNLITAGGPDLAIHLWEIDTPAMAPAIAAGGEGLAPFEALLEGGKEGSFYQEMQDYFVYAQLRAQGEDTIEARKINGRVPIAEVGNLMRALGFYPSEREIDEMTQEVHLTQIGEGPGDAVSFADFLKLYINHRPVLGTSKEQIAEAFKALGGTSISRDALLSALAQHGEHLGVDDLAQCLRALVGSQDVKAVIPETVDAPTFAEAVLGFEDYA